MDNIYVIQAENGAVFGASTDIEKVMEEIDRLNGEYGSKFYITPTVDLSKVKET